MSELPANKDDLIKIIEDPTGRYSTSVGSPKDAAKAKLDALLAHELNGALAQLSVDIHKAKEILGTRVSEMTKQLQDASAASSNHAAALVRWTRLLVAVTVVYAFAAVAQVTVTLWSMPGSAPGTASSTGATLGMSPGIQQ